ncbi:MAG: GTPase HflX [Oscillibacter sp.]|nr:GTPase HflX [Oscillibacter sp.]
MRETDEIRDKVVLVGLNSPVLKKDENANEETMEELSALVETAGGETVGMVLQNRPSPDPRSFIGEGKVEEVKEFCQNHQATMVIFDNDLSPSQMRVLTEALGVQVLDRCGLILDIFAQRAKTREGRLQVELAQYKYLLPRLTGMWTHLERQAGTSGKGPIGSKGPGETQLETDRRHIHRKIDKLREDLEDVRRVRGTQRQQRRKNEIPVVAIVGYTNAGKSTLLNKLTGAGIPANNRLFDTLDTTSRLLTVSDTLDVVISDTVGFIRKLPHQLVEAFKATLEELEYADLLLHVIDVSNPEWQLQAQVVESLILELGAGELPRIDVFNKSDAVPAGEILPHGEDICSISARTGEGLEKLMEMIDKRLDKGTRRVLLHLPYDKGGLLDILYREAKVEAVEYSETIDVTAVCGPRTLGQVQPYISDSSV